MVLNRLVNHKKAQSYVQNIQEIAKPLRDYFGIHGFCYHKVFSDYCEIMLGTDPFWVETIYQNNLAVNVEYVSPQKK